MKKVLQVSCEGLGNGGVQSVIMNICRTITDINFDILLFTDEERYYDKEFLSLGGKIFRIPHYEGTNNFRKRLDYYIRLIRIFLGTYKLLKENGPYDAIHCHNYFESGISTLAARFAGVKVRISHSHSTVAPVKTNWIRRGYYIFYKMLIKMNSNIRIGCSEQAIKYLYDDDKSALVVNNAIDLERFDKGRYLYCYHEDIRFINVGRYSPAKNQLFLLDVFSIVRKKLMNARLIMVGFGEYENLIAEKIISLELQESVKMLPSDSDIPKLLSESDYVIFPSVFEGLGIVLLEAQAMGVRCFVSNAVPPEADMGLCEYLDLKEGAEAWANYIVENISEDKINNKESVPEDVLNKYDTKEICKIYKKIYNAEKGLL